jgi:hypothetical protein
MDMVTGCSGADKYSDVLIKKKKILPKVSGLRLESRTRVGVRDHMRQAKGPT